jgi:hypothetical protein
LPDRRLITLIAALASVGLPTPATAGAAPTRSCGTLTLSDGYVHVKATGPTSCRTAMAVLQTHFDGPQPCTEWSCPQPARGWRCAKAPDRAFPHLATCRRGKAVAAAYSFAA